MFFSGYIENDQADKAIEMFTDTDTQRCLRDSTVKLLNHPKTSWAESPTVIYLCVINALSHVGNATISESIVKQIPSNFLVLPLIQNSLIDMWVSDHSYLCRLMTVIFPSGQSGLCGQGKRNLRYHSCTGLRCIHSDEFVLHMPVQEDRRSMGLFML